MNDHFRMLAHWILFRDILYKRIYVQKHLNIFLTTFGDLVYTGQFQFHYFLDTMVHIKQYNIDNFYNRGLFRMRYIIVGLLSLAIRTSNDPDYCPLAGPLFTITCMFSISIIRGGLTVCHEIRRCLLKLPPSEPQCCKHCFEHVIVILYGIQLVANRVLPRMKAWKVRMKSRLMAWIY